MKRDTLEKALEQISDRHIAEAAQPKKRRFPLWIPAVAAILALVILIGVIAAPFTSSQDPAWNGPMPPTRPTKPSINIPVAPEGYYLQYLAAAPQYPQMAPYPTEDDTGISGYDAWWQSQKTQYNQPEGYADSAEPFFSQITASLLSGEEGQNMACSPVNVYMALAMLAEVTEGETRQQILDALGADSIEALRTQAGHVWNAHYCADNATTLTLANSL